MSKHNQLRRVSGIACHRRGGALGNERICTYGWLSLGFQNPRSREMKPPMWRSILVGHWSTRWMRRIFRLGERLRSWEPGVEDQGQWGEDGIHAYEPSISGAQSPSRVRTGMSPGQLVWEFQT